MSRDKTTGVALGLDQFVTEQLRNAVRDGIAIGIQMGIDALRAAQPHTDVENQTWDSATALLAIVKANYDAARQSTPSAPASDGEGA